MRLRSASKRGSAPPQLDLPTRTRPSNICITKSPRKRIGGSPILRHATRTARDSTPSQIYIPHTARTPRHRHTLAVKEPTSTSKDLFLQSQLLDTQDQRMFAGNQDVVRITVGPIGPSQTHFYLSKEMLSLHSLFFSPLLSNRRILHLEFVEARLFRKLIEWLQFREPFDLIPDEDDMNFAPEETLKTEAWTPFSCDSVTDEIIHEAIMEGLEVVGLCYLLRIEGPLFDICTALHQALSSKDANSRSRITRQHIAWMYANIPMAMAECPVKRLMMYTVARQFKSHESVTAEFGQLLMESTQFKFDLREAIGQLPVIGDAILPAIWTQSRKSLGALSV